MELHSVISFLVQNGYVLAIYKTVVGTHGNNNGIHKNNRLKGATMEQCTAHGLVIETVQGLQENQKGF